jgi:hypothetical protein
LRPPKRYAQRHVAIRHKSKHRVVALIEIVSPVNKDRPASVRAFSQKIRTALELDVNVLVADLFPPGRHDSRGMHGAIWKRLGADRESPESDRPMCMMSYVAARPPIAYLEWRGAGAPLPKMPLFLDPKNYVNVPLEPTYQMAYRGVPEYWRHVIEQHAKS